MLSVPSVTIKGGSFTSATNEPLSKPKSVVTAKPIRMAMTGGTPYSTARLAINTDPNAITMPLDRSMPAVRIMMVWPMASVPTTTTC